MLHLQHLFIAAVVQDDAFVDRQLLLAVRVEGLELAEFVFEQLVLLAEGRVVLQQGLALGLADLAVDVIHGIRKGIISDTRSTAFADVEDVVAADQNLAQRPLALPVHHLFGVRQLY
jgi:hypothetical protein